MAALIWLLFIAVLLLHGATGEEQPNLRTLEDQSLVNRENESTLANTAILDKDVSNLPTSEAKHAQRPGAEEKKGAATTANAPASAQGGSLGTEKNKGTDTTANTPASAQGEDPAVLMQKYTLKQYALDVVSHPIAQRLFDKVETVYRSVFPAEAMSFDVPDAVIKFRDITDLPRNKGGISIIAKNEQILNLLQNPMHGQVTVVVGSFNDGKSWFINKAFDDNLPTGKNLRTEGLQVTVKNNNIIVEVQGAGRPALDDQLASVISRDTAFDEIVAYLPDVLIYVVNEVNIEVVNKIYTLYNKIRAKKGSDVKFVVVHNEQSYKDPVEMDTYINNTLLGALGAREDLGLLGRQWKSNNDKIFHFVLAREGTPAGNMYNEKSLEQLRLTLGVLVVSKEFAFLPTLEQIIPDVLPRVVMHEKLKGKGLVMVSDPKALTVSAPAEESRASTQKDQVPFHQVVTGAIGKMVSHVTPTWLVNGLGWGKQKSSATSSNKPPGADDQNFTEAFNFFKDLSPDIFEVERIPSSTCPTNRKCMSIVLKDEKIKELHYLPVDMNALKIQEFSFRPAFDVVEFEDGSMTIRVGVLDAIYTVSYSYNTYITVAGFRMPPKAVVQCTDCLYWSQGSYYSPFSVSIKVNNFLHIDLNKLNQSNVNGVLTLSHVVSEANKASEEVMEGIVAE